MDPIDLVLAGLLIGMSFLLLLQMVIAYLRVRNVKLILLACGFSLFFVEGVMLLANQVWESSLPAFAMSRELMILNLVILFLFYAGTVRR